MKKVILLIFCVIGLFSSCRKEESPALQIVGSWELIMLDGSTVPSELSVWLDFSDDGTFAIYQRADSQVLYRRLVGRWSVTGDMLHGTYDDGSSWASAYKIALSGPELTLTSSEEETTVYVKKPLPASVTDSVLSQ